MKQIIFSLFLLLSLNAEAKKIDLKTQLIDLNSNWNHHNVDEEFSKQHLFPIGEVGLIQTHLSLVEQELRAKDCSHLTQSQLYNRKRCLDILHTYWVDGVFPQNTNHKTRTPYFIDIYGTHCAVGQLIKETGYEGVAQKIHKENNNGYLNDLAIQYNEVAAWGNKYGFDLEELAWIQPGYFSYTLPYTDFSTDTFLHIGKTCTGQDGFIKVPHPSAWNAVAPWIASITSYTSIFTNPSLPKGHYEVYVSDAIGNYRQYNLFIEDSLMIDFSIQNISCTPTLINHLNVNNVVNGISPYTYTLTGGGSNTTNIIQTSNLFTSIGVGQLNLSVVDAGGCQTTTMLSSNAPHDYFYNTLTNPNCINPNSGSIVFDSIAHYSIVPFTPPFTYSLLSNGNWNTQNSPIINNLSYGIKTIKITDAHGCEQTNTYPVKNAAVDSMFQLTITNPLVCLGSQSPLSINIAGGTPPYSTISNYYWSANEYQITITDANNCLTDTVYEQLIYPPIVPSQTIITPIVCDGDTGVVQLSATGGIGPISNIGTFPFVEGANWFTHTDSMGCSRSNDVYTGYSQPLSISASSVSPLTCYTDSTSVIINGSGGAGLITGEGSFNITSGTHTFSISDLWGCTKSVTVNVTSPPQIITSHNIITPIICNGDSGLVNITATGGIGTISNTGNYLFTNGVNSFSVTDSLGCSATHSFIANQPPLLLISASNISPLLCYDDSASISINGIGGLGQITGIGSFNVPTNSSSSFSISDSLGCIKSMNINVSSPLQISMLKNSTPDDGTNNGTAQVVVSGGVAPYNYTWSNGSTQNSIVGVATGTYTIVIKDANNCILQDTIFVQSANPASLSQISMNPISIYPNPTKGSVEINFNELINTGELVITNLLGEIIFKNNLNKVSKENVLLKGASGIYIVKVTAGDKMYSLRLMKE
jgi:hypothetical protein